MWTYGSGLELNSPRFTQPGDFFTYVAFVGLVILVSDSYNNFVHHLSFMHNFTPRICPPSLTLAEAVPKQRKITLMTRADPSFAKLKNQGLPAA